VNAAYEKVSMVMFEDLCKHKKPSKLTFEAAKLLCHFVNAFREEDQKWPKEAFTSWVTVHHYLIGSPDLTRIFREFCNLRRIFNKAFTSRMTPKLCGELLQIRY
jgi:hypothetical protein